MVVVAALVLHGDALEVLRTIPDASVDACVTDPPAGIAFMGKDWDRDKGGRDAWIAWLAEIMGEVLRVLKPGGHALVWALPRTSHWTATAVEDAGFEIRDVGVHLFGTGFPKSLNVSKAIDAARDDRADVLRVTAFIRAGRDRAGASNADIDNLFDTVGMAGHWTSAASQPAVPTLEQWAKIKARLHLGDEMDAEVTRLNGRKGRPGDAYFDRAVVSRSESGIAGGTGEHAGTPDAYGFGASFDVTAPATPEAARWSGFGTALKPAAEHWILARRPLNGTVAANVLAHGCGALNVDGCRIGGTWDDGPSLCDSCVARAVETRLPSTPETRAISATSLAAQTSTAPAQTPPVDTCKTATGCFAGPSEAAPSDDPSGDSNSSTGACGSSTTAPFPMGSSSTTSTKSRPTTASRTCSSCGGRITTDTTTPALTGRWPANLTLDPDAAAELDAQSGNRPGMSGGGKHKGPGGMFGAIDGNETHIRADSGGASRFFYVAKPSTREREEGLDHLPRRSAAELTDSEEGQARLDCPRTGAGRTSKGRANHHPTVKSIALMRWLVRLITPPGGLVLDPFCGSGSTGCAAVLEGMSFVGIEQDPDYVAIATARIAHWEAK